VIEKNAQLVLGPHNMAFMPKRLVHSNRQGGTVKGVKETADARGLTVDEFINELMSPSGKGLVSLQPLWSKSQVQEPAEAYGQGASQTTP